MTQEDLRKIAMCYAHDELKDNHGDVEDIVAAAFIDGANYADQHPHWISVEDELPPKKSEYDDLSNNVLATDGKEIYESVYNHDFEDWFTHDMWGLDNITHWMPLPQAPLVTDLNKKDLPPVSWQEGNILVEEEGGEKMDYFTWKERYEYYRTKGYEQGYEDAINKACEWLKEQSCCGYIEDIDVNEFVEHFRKAMKGGEQ